jgi:hypothetical protein
LHTDGTYINILRPVFRNKYFPVSIFIMIIPEISRRILLLARKIVLLSLLFVIAISVVLGPAFIIEYYSLNNEQPVYPYNISSIALPGIKGTSSIYPQNGLPPGPDNYNIDNMFQTRQGFQRGYYVVRVLYDYKDKAATGAMGWLFSKYPSNSNKDVDLAMWRELDWEYVPRTDTTQPFNTQRHSSDNVSYYYLPVDFNPATPPDELPPSPKWTTTDIVGINYENHLRPVYEETPDGFYKWCNEVAAPSHTPSGENLVPNVQPPAWPAVPGRDPAPTPIPPAYPEVIALNSDQRQSGHFISYGSHNIPGSGTEGQAGRYNIEVVVKDNSGQPINTVDQYVWMPDLLNNFSLEDRHTQWSAGTSGFNLALTHFFYDKTGEFDAATWNYYVISILDDGIKFYVVDNWTDTGSLTGVLPVGEISSNSPCNAQALFDTPFAGENWNIMGLEQETSAMEFMFQMWMDSVDNPANTSWSGHQPDFATAEGYVSYISHYDEGGTQDYEVDIDSWDAAIWPNEFTREFFVNTYHPYNISFTEKNGDNALCLRIYRKDQTDNYLNQLKTDGIIFTEYAVTPDDPDDHQKQYDAFDHLRFEVYNPNSNDVYYEYRKYPYDTVDQGIMSFKQGTHLKVYATKPGDATEYYLGTITFGWDIDPVNGASVTEQGCCQNVLQVIYSEGTNCTHINLMLDNLIVGPNQAHTATGTGTASFFTDQGTIEDLRYIPENSLPENGKPDNIDFPHGLFSFKITGIAPGSTVTITKRLPSNMPADTQLWKFHNDTWVNCSSLLGDNDADNELTITITDGGPGDEDGIANGVIIDPGGAAIAAIAASSASKNMVNINTGSSSPINEKRLLTPSNLSVNSLNIIPGTVPINQPVTIYANITNRGDTPTAYALDLMINGQVEQTKSANIGEHATHKLVFTVYRDIPGKYVVDIEGQQASFTVAGSQGNSPSLQEYCYIILSVFAVLAILLTVLLARRRHSS